MSKEIVYCFEDREIEEAMSLMEAKQICRLPILSREKRLVGIVSLGDLAVHAGKNELLGETLKEVSRPAVPRRVNIKVIAVPDCENNDDYAESSRRPSR
jgi:CBS-domain-containing membrane protein